MRRLLTALVLCAVGWSASACAARTAVRPTASVHESAESLRADSLQTHIEKVRRLSARPVTRTSVPANVEQLDPRLAEALLELALGPTAELHALVGERYRMLGVADVAYEHFSRAVALNPRDAAAHDGLARIWRDWGLPGLALGDAHRAIFYAPSSAAAHNTMGTVLQALGQHAEARKAFELAGRLDPKAVYAVSNLCYLSFLQGDLEGAVGTCRAALAVDATYAAARNNLALAHAAGGRLDLARREFLVAGHEALGLFNLGVVHLANREYAEAARAFDAASRQDPTMVLARERASQARVLERTAARAASGDPK